MGVEDIDTNHSKFIWVDKLKSRGNYCNTGQYNKTLASENLDSTMLDNAHSRRDIVYKIPIVFHIIYHKYEENIKKDQILKQIESLNNDFRNRNVKSIPFEYEKERSLSADSNIEFVIATKKEGINIEGITSRHSPIESFETFKEGREVPLERQPVKSYKLGGQDAWDSTRYLNVWICNLKCGPGGYAQYPIRYISEDEKLTDGVVIDYRSFGIGGTAEKPYHLGKTLTHEVGHWLGLYHLWGSDDSGCKSGNGVEDTPIQRGPQCGCPTQHFMDQGCYGVDPLRMNFMDFWDDECSLFFTEGQVSRMRYHLKYMRESIINYE
jgi:hypothetical protein